jgi:FKBP-type peptidyl-prolyl cis-trans isomerase
MFNKFELIGGGISVAAMALAIYLVQIQTTLFNVGTVQQSAQVSQAREANVVVVADSADITQARAQAYVEASDNRGNINRMVIDDIKVGTGEAVKDGDTVSVHYIGTLQDGTEFDNSHKRGAPIDFTVGSGMVIKGWEEGLIGMKKEGQRVLVIPPEMAYGEQGIGPIPPNATLVFSLELVEIK